MGVSHRSCEYTALGISFFCKQQTAYDMRIMYWSSDVCSSDLAIGSAGRRKGGHEYNWKGNILFLQEIAYEHARIDVAVRDVVPVEPRVNQIIALDFNSLLDGEFATVIIVGVEYQLAIKRQIGSESCRERGCKYVYISVDAVQF